MATSSDDPAHVDSGGSRCEPQSARSLADVLLARNEEGHEDYSRKKELLSIARPLRTKRKTEPAHPYQLPLDPVTSSTEQTPARTASSTPVARFVHQRVLRDVAGGEPVRFRVRGKMGPPADMMRWYSWYVGKQHVSWAIKATTRTKFEKWFLHYSGISRHRHGGMRKAQYALTMCAWQGLTASEQAMWHYWAMQDPPRSAIEIPDQKEEDEAEESDDEDNPRLRSAMLTFNGSWGQDLQVVELWVQNEGLSGQALTDKMKLHPFFQDLSARFFKFMSLYGTNIGWHHVSTSLEHCHNGDTASRVHLHAYMSPVVGNDKNAKRVDMKQLLKIKFDGCYPMISTLTAMKKGYRQTDFVKRKNEGHYYLQFPKIGMIHQLTNYPKLVAFAVQRKWIFNQFRTYKMTLSDALEECLHSRDGFKNAKAELEAIEQANRSRLIMLKVKDNESKIESCRKPFIPFTANMLEWKTQYDPQSVLLSRFKVLVLDGASRVGKTTWAKTLFGSDRTLVVDCQKCSEPNLREFYNNQGKYTCILFDEGHWQLVHDNKGIFQATNAPVSLGQSSTNIFAYTVHLYSIAMIVCSNDFWRDDCPPVARDYLDKNIVYEKITDKVYVD